ncbi:MAG: Ca2+-dependent phosphoinositide-specific phospholipase C [Oligoflexales bacterium]
MRCASLAFMSIVLTLLGCGRKEDLSKSNASLNESSVREDILSVLDDTPFNAAYQLACHNCYDSKYWNGTFEEVFDAIQVVEVDIFDTTLDIFSSGQKHDWYVGHLPVGNDNNCGGSFSSCLEMLSNWMRRNPEHDVVTFFIDKKQGWGNTRNPEDLDDLLLRYIPREHIFSPSDLARQYDNVRTAIKNKGWPTMGALKGKVMFAVTGGSGIFSITRNRTLDQYVQQRGKDAVAFVAPDATSIDHILSVPTAFSEGGRDWVAFFNLKRNQARLGSVAFQQRLVTRIWGGDKLPFCDLVNRSVNLVALYQFFHREDLGCDEKGVIQPR